MVDWQRVRSVFSAVHGLVGEALERELDRHCAGDAALRAEVAELLAAGEADDGFLARPALGTAPLPRIAGFEVVELLGEGGMGQVYAAMQRQPRRRVALKMLRAGLTTPEFRARFAYEADALGRLRHPGIAQVFEVGLTDVNGPGDARPWIALEFVEDARPIDAFATQRRLGLRARIELFLQVCDAVHHAHLRGVVHRDLKPDNVLVDGSGRAKVIDFGVAALVAEGDDLATRLTRAGTLLGTLAYMSPEQAAGDEAAVDARTDVYSLGVMLYELVTGCLPHELEGLALHAAVRVLCEEPPRRPDRALGLDRDLEVAMLTAMARTPERRYASVAAFAADLERYLALEPIAARPPTLAYQWTMFARRHRAAAVASVIVVLALVGTAVATTLQGLRASRAESAERAARERTDELFSNLLEASTASVFETAHKLRFLPGTTEIQVEMLSRSVADLERLHELAPGNRELRRRLAMAHVQLAVVYAGFTSRHVGEWQKGRASAERALDLVAPLLAAAGGAPPVVRRIRTDALSVLADQAVAAQETAEATRLYGEILDELEALERIEPGEPEWVIQRASVFDRLGTLDGASGDHEAALAMFDRARTMFEKVRRQHPDAPNLDDASSANHSKRASALSALGRNDEAVEAYEAGCAEIRRAVGAEPDNSSLRTAAASLELGLGRALWKADRIEEARPILVSGLERIDGLLERDMANVQLRIRRALGTKMLGDLDMARGAPGEASMSYARCRDELRELERAGKLAPVFAGLLRDAATCLARCAELTSDGQ